MATIDLKEERNSSKLSLIAFVREEQRIASETLHNLEKMLGTLRSETDPTCNFVRGYLSALSRIVYHDQL
jgi:hypothetical protein